MSVRKHCCKNILSFIVRLPIFSAGDTLLLRFRLYSDPFANGWGWVVEDLKIDPLIDAVTEINNHPVTVYPNPGKGLIKISTDIAGVLTYKPLRYSVFNAAGICLRNAITSGSSEILADIFPSRQECIL